VVPSSIGDFFFAVGADRAIRVWKQTQEQTFIVTEKREREEKLMIKEAEEEMHQE